MNEKNENKIHKFNNVIFQKLEEYDAEEIDTRFIKGKIWICHTGSNYNASYFSEETILNALSSLSNTPILCFYTTNKDGEDDFGGHEYQIERIDDQLEYVCKEYAIGVISESDSLTAKMEDRLCDDGIIRRFATCRCTLWTKFNQAMSIFEKQNIKGQSMEITDVEGSFEDDNLYHITKFLFNGCTILSNDCIPAMQNSTIEVNFSANKSIAEEIENKLNQFTKYFSKKEEEVENMTKKQNKIEETQENKEFKKVENQTKVEDNSKEQKFDSNSDNDTEADQAIADAIEDVAEVLDEIEDNLDGGTDEDSEEDFGCKKDKENMACDDKDQENDNMDDMPNKMSKEENKKKYTLIFSLSFEDIRSLIYDKLYDMENIENTCYGIIETKDNYFIYADYCTGQFYKQSYMKDDTTVTFTGEREEIFNVFVDQETKNAIANVTYSKLQEELEKAKSKIQEYSKANETLLSFQAEVKEKERKLEVDKVISRFSKINELDLEKYRQKAYKKELNNEELEEKLYAELGKMNFSASKVEKQEDIVQAPINYSVSLTQEKKDDFAYGEDLKQFFIQK